VSIAQNLGAGNTQAVINIVEVDSPSAVPSRAPTVIPSSVPSTSPTNYPSLSPNSNSVITTIAGTGTSSYSGDDDQATSATLSSPWGVIVDSSNNVYIADASNNRVRKITASTGIISTIAGNGVGGNYVGNGGQATSAQIWVPADIAVDTSNDLYITNLGSHYVLKVTVSTGIITTVAGTGTAGHSGNGGAATSAKTYWPTGWHSSLSHSLTHARTY